MTKEAMITLLELPADEKVEIAHALLDSVSDSGASWRPTEAQIQELERRAAVADRNPESGSSWAEVKERILRRHG